ncbi:MAG: 1-(5-phosphoribosyl)-5-[(5-phosphoribosylamino)methylideneamino]imidazole-4-carboxamide isomerase [Clostridia bacterium]|nr:1-(5-phosphoribosyl)-5-[(5-phosphoribosylamino)methylideneamino]imidazole-4-carboxamide isomerase [Clostridia bacterium]
MLLLPAIDLRQGRCVRLYQGKLEAETVYATDPVAVARQWASRGAAWLHVVDLDGAFAGQPRNIEIIKAIIKAVPIPVQVGGGIRSLASLENILAAGAARVVLGTAAVSRPEMVAGAVARFGEQVVVGIDSRDGQVAVEGWAAAAGLEALDFARQMAAMGVKRAVFTDISRDGTLAGPNFSAIKEIALQGGLKIIASGGIASLDDLRHLQEMEALGVEGAILGRALYNGNFSLEEALGIAGGVN